MSLVLDDTTLGIWFVYSEKRNMDVMGALNTTPEGYKLTWRFRYYDPTAPDPWAGKDKKHWYNATFSADREHAMQSAQEFFAMVADSAPGELDEVLRLEGETPEAFFDRFRERPWVHAKQEKITAVN